MRDELTFERASARIGRSMMAIAVIGTAVAFSARGWPWALGFLVGSLISGLNFRWLRRMVQAIAVQPGSSAGLSKRGVFLAARYLLLGGGAYVILRYSPINLTALIIGLFVLTGAVFVEVVFEIIYGRK